MLPLVLYCKSYRTDLKRVRRLAESIQKFNTDDIPFFVSTPDSDYKLFNQYMAGTSAKLLTDESILSANSAINIEQFINLPGNIGQQIVKSEFWRTDHSASYLCLDSDCFFIKPFSSRDFLTKDGTPYTIIDEGRDLMRSCLSNGKIQILENFQRESKSVQIYLGRDGKHYNFGPNCPVWDRRVWQSLDEGFLRPQKKSFLDIILLSPNEQRWYGEALLKYKAIDLHPSQPFFKMYHYAWQRRKDIRSGIGLQQLASIYSGVSYQSAWERQMDWPKEGGSVLSKLGRRIRTILGRT